MPDLSREARAALVAELRSPSHGCPINDCACPDARAAAQLEADGERIASLEAMEARAKDRLGIWGDSDDGDVARGPYIASLLRYILTGKESSDGNS